MRKRNLFAMLLALLVLAVVASPALATPAIKSPPAYQQERDGWCWAAVDKSIIQYYKGSSPSQTTLWNDYDQDKNSPGASINEANNALKGNGIKTSLQLNCLTFSGVQWQINNNRMIFAGLHNSYFMGHANLIRGYDTVNSQVYFIDPSDGKGHAQNYNDYKDGYHWDNWPWTWDESIFDTGRV